MSHMGKRHQQTSWNWKSEKVKTHKQNKNIFKNPSVTPWKLREENLKKL